MSHLLQHIELHQTDSACRDGVVLLLEDVPTDSQTVIPHVTLPIDLPDIEIEDSPILIRHFVQHWNEIVVYKMPLLYGEIAGDGHEVVDFSAQTYLLKIINNNLKIYDFYQFVLCNIVYTNLAFFPQRKATKSSM